MTRQQKMRRVMDRIKKRNDQALIRAISSVHSAEWMAELFPQLQGAHKSKGNSGMTVQQFKERFNLHPQSETNPPGVTLPEPPPPPQGLRGPLPGADGPIPVPPGGFPIDPSLFDMPDLRV